MSSLVYFLLPLLVLIAGLEIPPLVKRREWGELSAFVFLWLWGTILNLGVILKWPLPNPTKIILFLLQPFRRWFLP
ncbi:MAG: hypothetical protein M1299_04315 [Firmicutes bacterium]|nr:hypothetical protein [Bacillota bacterium]MCL5039039.1 hypothetical protein [Bacillota bacterium]